MESEAKKFGRGARELNGAVDLISQNKLDPQHEFFCRRALPGPISETHYLYNVPGDTEIRRGLGMELDQLFDPSLIPPSSPSPSIRLFELDSLRLAFSFRDAAPIILPAAERGAPTISGNVKQEPKDESRKEKKHRDKEHKKHKHRHKDRSKDKDKDRDRKKDKDRDKKDKKRKHDGAEDLADGRDHKKSKAESTIGQR